MIKELTHGILYEDDEELIMNMLKSMDMWDSALLRIGSDKDVMLAMRTGRIEFNPPSPKTEGIFFFKWFAGYHGDGDQGWIMIFVPEEMYDSEPARVVWESIVGKIKDVEEIDDLTEPRVVMQ